MPTLNEIREKYPQYNDMDDAALAMALHKKFYADMPIEEFSTKIGYNQAPKQEFSALGEATAPFRGFNTGIDALINLPGTLGNLGAAGVNYGAGLLGYDAPLPDEPFKPIPVATNVNADYEPQTTLGQYGQTIGEVGGSAIIPEAGLIATAGRMAPKALQTAAPILQRTAAAGPTKTLKAAVAPTVGSGAGVQAARDADLGPAGELAAGLAGGFALPNIVNIGSRSLGVAQQAKNYAGKQFDRAGNPQLAADQDTVDALLKAGVDPERLFQEFAPTPSASLQARGITNEKLADMIGRAVAKEPLDKIAKDYGISEATLRDYLRQHKAAHPTPRNVTDVVQDITNVGSAQPVLRLGRTAFGIADEGNAAGALTGRQNDQYGRMVNIIRSAAKGRDYDATLADLDETLGAKSRQAYTLAHQNEQPFDLRPNLAAHREAARNSAGEIRDSLNKAIDLFFEPVAQPKRISAMEDVRMKEMSERIAKAEAAENPDPQRIMQLRRRFDAMRDDAEFNANAKPEIVKIGKPISDVPRYQAAREALDQMIEASKNAQGKATPLTRKLTAFRKSINQTVRDANPYLAAADDQFSGAMATQELLKRGEQLTTQLGSKTDDFFKDFGKLSPEQREIVRLAFLRKLENQAARPQEGAAVANQFRSNAVKQTIQRLFGPEKIKKGMSDAEIKALRARNKENTAIGNTLIRQGREEATTTGTLNYLTGRGNSPTAPWQRDMAVMEEGAQLVGDAMTLNWRGVLQKTGKKLANQIGERTSKEILDNLTNTAPEEVIPKIRRWVQIAKTAEERRAYVLALKEFGRALRDRPVDIGTATETASEPR